MKRCLAAYQLRATLIGILIVLGLICPTGLFAEEVDSTTAKTVAQNFYMARMPQRDAIAAKRADQGIRLHLTHTESRYIQKVGATHKKGSASPLYYIFNAEDEMGFVIVSGDDRAPAILGFAFEGRFSMDDQAPALQDWMNNYQDQIAYIIENDLEGNPEFSEDWANYLDSPPTKTTADLASVAPMISTKWNQGCYYNSLCPEDNTSTYCERALVGCVAVAMGQIMKYWDYPNSCYAIPSYESSNYGPIPAIPATMYNWSSMPISLSAGSTDAQENAVATLLYHCGVSVRMIYGPSGSGAYSSNAASAFKNIFKYETSLQYLRKSSFSDADWVELLLSELDSGRPIYYRGCGNGCHAFVCDGYKGDDHFHFNWGWGGYSDGYFYVEGVVNVIRFQYSQEVAIGIEPGLDPIKTIAVSNPGADMVWRSGTTQEITWTDNVSEDVKIEWYADDWTLLEVLSSSTPSDGSFTWSIPATVPNYSGYKIKVLSTTDDQVFGWSKNLFRIPNIDVPESLDIDQRAGTVFIDVKSNVSWTVSESADWLTVSKDGNSIAINHEANLTSDDRSATITVSGEGISKTIVVTQFSILNPDFISITAPESGAVWHSGSTQEITWNDNINEDVKIEWYADDWTLLEVLSENTPSDGRFTWSIPATVPNYGGYKIKVLSTIDNQVFGWSKNLFKISNIDIPESTDLTHPSGSKTIQVTSNVNWSVSDDAPWLTATREGYSIAIAYDENPTSSPRTATVTVSGGGISKTMTVIQAASPPYIRNITTTSSNWTGGMYVEISWEDNISENVRIDLYKDDSFVKTLSESEPSTGIYEEWSIGVDAGPGYQIKISSTTNSGLNAFSDDFALRPYIYIGSQYFGLVWQAGTTGEITWHDNLPENVKIDLFNGDSFVRNIVQSAPSTGSFMWNIPASLPEDTDYKIKVSSVVDSEVSRMTWVFTILKATEYVTVTAPSSGTVWHSGTKQEITWEDNISENVKIEWYADDWTLLEVLSASAESDGSFDWNIPATVPNYAGYKIKVLSTTDDQMFGWSKNLFHIPNIDVPASLDIAQSSGSETIEVTSNVDWSVNDDAGWLTATRDGYSIAVSYEENPSVSPRTATITVSGSGISKTILITQAAAPCNISITPASHSVGAAQGTTSFDVSSNVTWDIVEDAAWFTATKDGDAINVSYDANPSTTLRSATITLSGEGCAETVTLTQSGSDCSIIVTPASQSVDATSGTTDFDVSSNVDWNVSDDASWLTVTKNGNRIDVTFTENTENSPRTATITVHGGNCTESVTVIQEAAACSIELAPADRSVFSTAGTTSFSVTANVSWTVSDDAAWLTTSSGVNSINVSYEANPDITPRSATITVSGGGCSETVTLNQAGADCHISVTPASRSVGSLAGSSSFSVTANVEWTVSEDAEWLTATKTGEDITVIYDANPSTDQRSASITISGGTCTEIISLTQSGEDCSITVEPLGRTVGSSASTTAFSVSSNVDWSVSDDASWLDAIKNGNLIEVGLDANLTFEHRSATITVFGGGCVEILTVTQSGEDCSIIATPVSRSVGAEAGTSFFEISANMEWTVNTDAGWLTATKNGSSIELSYEANPLEIPRSASITVSGGGCAEVLTVDQAPATPWTLSVSNETLSLDKEEGSTATFDVFSNGEWTVEYSSDWLICIPAGGSDNGTVTLMAVSANEEVSETRTATVRIVLEGILEKEVIVSQLGEQVFFRTSVPEIILGASQGSSHSFNIETNIEWDLDVSADWFTVTPMSGSGTTIIVVDVLETNNSGMVRTDTIVAKGGAAELRIVVKQEFVTNVFDQVISKISLYPNPADQELVVNLGAELEDFVVRITDKRGALVHVEEFDRISILQIDLSKFQYGGYQLEIIQGENRIVMPFVKL